MISPVKGLKALVQKLTPEQAFGSGAPIIGSGGSTAWTVSPAYHTSAIAYACIRRLATDAGNAPFLILTDPEDPSSTVPESHPIARLFNTPNQWYSTIQFMEMIYTMLNLRGEFFITFDNPQNPKEMIPFHDPLYWKENVSSDRRLLGYEFRQEQLSFPSLPSDVIHHRLVNIRNPFRGQSPLEAATTALWTEISGDALSADLMGKGGEQGIVYKTDEKLIPKQEEELTAALKARRTNRATIANDILLTGGMDILDPKFTGFDYELFKLIGPNEQKIIQVYGLSPSLIGRDDEPNFATFQGRLRVYWQQTLLPMITAVESTFDKYLDQFGVYFRYDQANISGLQADMKEQSQIALILNRGGIPWTVIEDRLKLGLDIDSVPGADETMVAQTLAPLSILLEEWQAGNVTPSGTSTPSPEPTPDPEEPKQISLPDYKEAVARSKDINSLIARNRALAGLERAVSSGWRKLAGSYKKSALKEWDKAETENRTVDGAVTQFRDRFSDKMYSDMADDAVKLIQPRHIDSLGVGETSIEEITKRLSADDIDFFRKQPQEYLSAASLAFIQERELLVVNMPRHLFDAMMDDISVLVSEGGHAGEISGTVRQMISGAFTASVNRAVTIGRTEVGTAYNVGRFNNMKEQGYEHHEWITNIDEFTRDDHEASDGEVRKIGEDFPSGLPYPQAPGGDPEQVINCRCMVIPLTQEQFDERS